MYFISSLHCHKQNSDFSTAISSLTKVTFDANNGSLFVPGVCIFNQTDNYSNCGETTDLTVFNAETTPSDHTTIYVDAEVTSYLNNNEGENFIKLLLREGLMNKAPEVAAI